MKLKASKLELLGLSCLLVFIGTGLSTQFPGVAYLPVAGVLALLFLDRRFFYTPFRYLESGMLKGVALFNGFLWLQIIFSRLSLEEYFFPLFAVSMMVLAYTSARLILEGREENYERNMRYMSILLMLGLAVLLFGQWAQIMGYIQQVNFEGSEADILLTRARPGGFLNPNTTAAIAVVLLFALMQTTRAKKVFFVAPGLLVAATSVMLAQSRAALLVLAVLFVILLLKNSLGSIIRILLMFGAAAYFIYATYSDEITLLAENFMLRFEGDASSDERQMVLGYSLEAISESPIWGNGSRHLVDALGVSSHNQIIEIMVSYGLIGLLTLGLAFVWLYLPVSIPFFICCMLPLLLFSHNFFDSYAYQLVLGLALAIDRVTRLRSTLYVTPNFHPTNLSSK